MKPTTENPLAFRGCVGRTSNGERMVRMAEQILIIEDGTLTKFECDDYRAVKPKDTQKTISGVITSTSPNFGRLKPMPGNRKEKHNG